MKNLYKNTLEEIKLDEAAKDKICDGIINKLKEEKSEKPRVSFSLKAFRLAAACASAVLVCGTAIGTGIYFGLNGEKGDGGYTEVDIPRFYCYYMGYELEEFEQDINDFELNLYYGFDEQAVRGRYNQVLEEAKEKGYGEVLKYEIILTAKTYNRNEDGKLNSVIIDRLEIEDINEFPFNDYRVTEEEKDGVVIERTYEHSEKIIVPNVLFEKGGTRNGLVMYLYERIEYEIGYSDYQPSDKYWTEGGKVANDIGYVKGFKPVDNSQVYFIYELDNGKIKIDKTQFDNYEYTFISYETRLPVTIILQPSYVKSNLIPIYRN